MRRLPIASIPLVVGRLLLDPRPDLSGQGLAHLPSGEDIGPVPGVVLIPVHQGETVETSIVVWDESGVETAPISLAGCAADRVCLLTAIPQP